MMRIYQNLRASVVAFSLMLLCSCAAPPHTSFTVVQSPGAPAGDLPGEISMNWDAGLGNELIVMVKLGSGEPLPFIMDTGASGTIFDKSLEPQLGKRLMTTNSYIFGVKCESDTYLCPPLYLGSTPLMMTGPYVDAIDLSQISTSLAVPVKGVLGMDVLAHYCLQLDFRANRIRFLQPKKTNRWGKPFPLIDTGDRCFYISENLAGTNGPGSLIDTGCNYDGWLVPDLFTEWANQAPLRTNGEVFPHYAVLDGQVYPQVYLQGLTRKQLGSGDTHLTLNGIGLSLLSRNLVTLDFPGKTMFLKPTRLGPLWDRHARNFAWRQGSSAVSFLQHLKRKGQLPGWSKNDNFPVKDIRFHFQFPDTITFDNLAKGWDRSHYHYEVRRTSKNGPWKLVNAWRTDPNGRVLEKYPVP